VARIGPRRSPEAGRISGPHLRSLSILTGFPFGHHHHAGANTLFPVPVMIGPIHLGLGYRCWLVATVLLGQAETEPDGRKGRAARLDAFAPPTLAAAVMTMWDVSTDHRASTVSTTRIRENGGGLFAFMARGGVMTEAADGGQPPLGCRQGKLGHGIGQP
jgi:hypothetical protein